MSDEELRSKIEALEQTCVALSMALQEQKNGDGGMMGSQPIAIPVIDGGVVENFGLYEIQSMSQGSITFSNCYFRTGGKTYSGPSSIQNATLPTIVALKIDITGSTPSATLVTYNSMGALQTDEANEDYYIHPLYKMSGTGEVECDFRIGPTSGMGEFGGVPS